MLTQLSRLRQRHIRRPFDLPRVRLRGRETIPSGASIRLQSFQSISNQHLAATALHA